MTENVEEIETEDGTAYRYDESVFTLDHAITEERILAEWDEWWNYQPPEPPAPIEPMTNEELTAELEIQAQAIEELASIIGGDE